MESEIKSRFEVNKKLQKDLLQQIESILIIKPEMIENVGGDIRMDFFKGLEFQFSIDVCLECTEFYYSNGHRVFDVRANYYIEDVLSFLMDLIEQHPQ